MSSSTSATTQSHAFRVLTWNVLAQSYTFSHETDAAALEWPIRGERILTQINQLKPEIFALQEVDHWEELYRQKLIQMGYEVRYARRNGDYDDGRRREKNNNSEEQKSNSVADEDADDDRQTAANPVLAASSLDWQSRSSSKRSKTDGIVIGWRQETFELDFGVGEAAAVHVVDYDDLAFAVEEVKRLDEAATASSTSTFTQSDGSTAASSSSASVSSRSNSFSSSGSHHMAHELKYLRHNVGMFLFLKHRGSNQTLLLANTHLYWNPMHEDVKLAQLQYLMERIERECRKRRSAEGSSLEQDLNNLSLTSSAATPFTSTSSYPFILLGDLNSSPLSKLYEYITTGVYERKSTVEEVDDGTAASTAAIVAGEQASSSTTPAPSAPIPYRSRTPRFICDSDLSKVAKWLRSIGIDCAHYNDKEKKAKGGAVGFFKRAIDEKRIILTRSMRLIERRGCPQWFLLRNENMESSFAALILHFGLQFEEDLFYSRCIFCNSSFDAYPAAYFLGGKDEETGIVYEKHEPFPDIPRGFINMGYKDEQGAVLTFQRCRNEDRQWNPCGKLFWWGTRSGAAVDMFAARIDAALHQQHREDGDVIQEQKQQAQGGKKSESHDATPDCVALPSPPERVAPIRVISEDRQHQLRLASRIISSWADRDRRHASSSSSSSSDTNRLSMLPLRSAYATIDGREPDFTNLTSTFHDTLDYIFFAEPKTIPTGIVGSDTTRPSPLLSVTAVRRVTDDSYLDLVALERETCGAKPAVNPKQKKIRRSTTNPEEEIETTSSEEDQTEPTQPAVPLSLVLPNLRFPSDHLLLQATFEFANTDQS